MSWSLELLQRTFTRTCRLPRAVVRPPLVKIREPEIARIGKALVAAGLMDESGKRLEAA